MMANRIREQRKRLGWTLEKLASAAGTTPQQISRLERSERGLDDDWLGRLAEAMGIGKIDLLREVSGIQPSLREFAKDPQEVRLLLAWRALDPAEQATFLRVLDALTKPCGKPDDVRRSG